MPLLKKKTLEKAPLPEFLRDDEEVFHCEMTNEIFRDYDEFAERTILCNSMVWTCSLTGKSNLTYDEALQSEETAITMLKEFPIELKIPLLFLASLTHWDSFKDMAESINNYTKDRYFLGEKIEANFTPNKWGTYFVAEVIAPSEDEIKNFEEKDSEFSPPSALFKYNVKQSNSESSELMIVDTSKVRRKKSSYSREKSKLFLKQYVEQTSNGCIAIKQSVLEEFGIKNKKFTDIFDGPTPHFKEPKKVKNIVNVKKVKQETLAKFLSKNNIIDKSQYEDSIRKRAERERVREELKQKRIEEKEKQKQKNLEVANMLRDWHMPKEDLTLEDQKVLPEPTPFTTNLPEAHIGDALSIIEFVNTFAKQLRTNDYFTGEFNMELMEEAVNEKDLGGPLMDLFLLLLCAIFEFQENEKRFYTLNFDKAINEHTIDVDEPLTTTQATKLSTVAGLWCRKHHGYLIRQLPVYTLTISEIIRLHLLGSGARLMETGEKFRTYHRGGYTSEEDPAVHFRMHNAHIIKALGYHHVTLLPIGDILKIILCLIEQCLTYTDIRNVIEERNEVASDCIGEIRKIKANERKQLTEISVEKSKLMRKNKANSKKEIDELDDNRKEISEKNVTLLKDLYTDSVKELVILGYDRAMRQYLLLKSIPGLFVFHDFELVGSCINDPVRQINELIDADRDIIMRHLHKLSDEMNTSDKENSAPKANGHCHSPSEDKKEIGENNQLRMCSADPLTCIVHSAAIPYTKWSIFSDITQIDELIATLNKRGNREADLRQNISHGYNFIKESIVANRTPSEASNRSSTKKSKNANLGYPLEMSHNDVLRTSLVETILELESKLFENEIGGFKRGERRDLWRATLRKQEFEKLDTDVYKGKATWVYYDNENPETKSVTTVNPEIYLGPVKTEKIEQTEEDSKRIKSLAIALDQVAWTVNSKSLRQPLGPVIKKGMKDSHLSNYIKNWEASLLSSTSFSQIFLHYGTFEKCIIWRLHRKPKQTKCGRCRRGGGDFLMCDNCNKYFHKECVEVEDEPEGDWFCKPCAIEMADEESDEKMSSESEEESDDEEKPCSVCNSTGGDEVIKCVSCKLRYHCECISLRRPPRTKWTCNTCLNFKETDGLRRRREETRQDLPLHNVMLQELLVDVMKHPEAWPFLRPVQKIEVPDYYDIISRPMDFGTLKYKLNMGEYKYDAEFMADAQLIFDNCKMYNSTTDEVYECGQKVLKHFVKRCKDLNLRTPLDMHDDEMEPERKRRRIK